MSPRLFQIKINGSINIDGKNLEHTEQHLQVVIDEADLKNSVKILSSHFSEVKEIKTTEISVGYSLLMHEICIEGCKVMQISG
jgi:hypothetical protein